MTMKRIASILRLCLLFVLLAGLAFPPQSPVYALTTLTVEPLTWNVIGLDSNNVSVGPNHFPVGARVCNTGSETATNVTATWNWTNADTTYLNLRGGTLSAINLGTLNPGTCADAYFEVAVTRNAGAYDQTRPYRIDVTAGNVTGTISTPTPRVLYVEHLVSQNRNGVTNVEYGSSLGTLASVPAGGTMNLMVGNTYYIRMSGFTATQGYEQIEYFVNIPNTIFQVLSVSSTFDADTSATVGPSPIDKLYGNNCVWENDPNSPNYRSCLSTGKTGGNITVTYQVRILQVPSSPLVNPVPLSTLIYDFSGSSYHYNADYSVSARFANIVNASIEKSFSPKTITPGSNSTLTFTINNPGAAPLNDVNFTDDLPNNLNLANGNVGYSGCGTPSPTSGSLVDPMSFSNITVAGNSTCTITVTVTSNTNGSYANTTSTLKLGTADTGDTASDTLVVSSQPAPPPSCTTATTLAAWTLPTTTVPPTYDNPPGLAAGVTAAAATAGLTGAGSQSSQGGNPGNGWAIADAWLLSGTPDPNTTPYFQFSVDTSNYGGISIQFDHELNPNGNWAAGNDIYVFSSNGSGFVQAFSATSISKNWTNRGPITAVSTGAAQTTFRIIFVGRKSNPPTPTSRVILDNITIRGCPRPTVPTMSKAFATNPIPVGGASLLTITLNNPNAATNLTGVSFTDVLPGGLVINTPSGLVNNCGGTATATAGTQTISLSGGTITQASSCTIQVSVRGSAAGSYTNTSTNITSAETGPNTSTTPNVGFGQASLTVIAPPVISKSFTANPIFTGNTTTLNFTIANPNTSTALTGVAVSDVLPVGLTVADGTFSACGGTNNLTTTAATRTIALTGGTIAANGNCTFSVTVTGATIGLKNNVTGNVTSTNGGTGNAASADVLVRDLAPGLTLLKQVGPTVSGPWTSFLGVTAGSNVYYRFVVENTGDIALTGVDVTDPDPNVDPSTCSWVDGDGTPLTAPFNLPVANANDDQLAICVIGPVTAASGSHTNTATVDDNNPSTPSASDTSTATYATPGLTLDKTSAQSTFNTSGDTLNYSYLVTNSGSVPLLGPVTVADDKATVTCPAVSTVGDNDNWFDPGESITCTASYTVLPADATAGFVTNTATATVSSVNSNQDSVTVNQVRPDLTVTKTNNVSGSVAQNGTFNWTLTVANSGTLTASFAGGQTILSDTLPGVAGYYPQGALTVTNGATPPTGTINCSITGTALSCVASGAVTLPVNASFSITFAVTPTAAGSLANTATVDPNGNITESNEGNNTGSDTVTVTVASAPSIQLTKTPTLDMTVVGSTTVADAGDTITYTFSVQNTGNVTLT
ncbi:MAG TPA: CARDB domain-containing protein, partial [Anaerolineales bacterium]